MLAKQSMDSKVLAKQSLDSNMLAKQHWTAICLQSCQQIVAHRWSAYQTQVMASKMIQAQDHGW